jgi:hypothetical protein
MLAVILAPPDLYPGDGQDPMPTGKGAAHRQALRLHPDSEAGPAHFKSPSRSSAMPVTPGRTSAEGPTPKN